MVPKLLQQSVHIFSWPLRVSMFPCCQLTGWSRHGTDTWTCRVVTRHGARNRLTRHDTEHWDHDTNLIPRSGTKIMVPIFLVSKQGEFEWWSNSQLEQGGHGELQEPPVKSFGTKTKILNRSFEVVLVGPKSWKICRKGSVSLKFWKNVLKGPMRSKIPKQIA